MLIIICDFRYDFSQPLQGCIFICNVVSSALLSSLSFVYLLFYHILINVLYDIILMTYLLLEFSFQYCHNLYEKNLIFNNAI